MSSTKNGAPEGHNTVTAHLVFKDSAKAIEFYKKAFGAEEICRLNAPDGKIMHAAVRIGDTNIFMCDEMDGCPDQSIGSAESVKKATVTMHMFVPDCDAAFKRAVDAGCSTTMPPMDMFWGDRYGRVVDPFGQPWSIATHKEDLTKEQMEQRCKEAFAQMAGAKK